MFQSPLANKYLAFGAINLLGLIFGISAYTLAYKLLQTGSFEPASIYGPDTLELFFKSALTLLVYSIISLLAERETNGRISFLYEVSEKAAPKLQQRGYFWLMIGVYCICGVVYGLVLRFFDAIETSGSTGLWTMLTSAENMAYYAACAAGAAVFGVCLVWDMLLNYKRQGT